MVLPAPRANLLFVSALLCEFPYTPLQMHYNTKYAEIFVTRNRFYRIATYVFFLFERLLQWKEKVDTIIYVIYGLSELRQ